MSAFARIRYKLYGAAALVVVAVVGYVAVGLFQQEFVSYDKLTVKADRSGLILEKDQDIKFRGVKIGKIADVKQVEDGVLITADVERGNLEMIPANVRATIKAKTAFGAKFISLDPRPQPTSRRLSSGDALRADHVASEANDVLENLQEVLHTVEPGKLNAALSGLATGLEGRGDELGKTLVLANAYLGRLNGHLPTVKRDIAKTADVAELYADVAPDLLRVLDNATFTSGTIVDKQDSIDTILRDVTTLSGSVRQVLVENEQNLVTALDLLRPTTSLVARYSSELPCLLRGLDNANKLLEPVEGGTSPYLNLNVGFLPGAEPYRYPKDLPIVGARGGPGCYGLPLLKPSEVPTPYRQRNTGTNIFPEGRDDRLGPGDPPLVTHLFGPLAQPKSEVGPR
ncbi:MAG: MCE family protein [Rhodospirillales bacterium]|nr:MCE family protein [Rhodospirillales bacterium]